ncbi:MAG: DMT family transporter [Chlorobiales bacterium]|nr:DMT family transporter [Chlorobiales bacterium]
MKTNRSAWLAMSGQSILAGLSFAFARNAAVEFGPFVLLLMRTSGAALFFAILFLSNGGFKGRRKPVGSEWVKLGMLAFVGVAFNQFLFLLGLKFTTPANSAVLYTLTPMIVLLISVFLMQLERLSVQKVGGIVVAMVGASIVLFAQKQGSYGLENKLMLGNLITLVAVISWSFYLAYAKVLLPQYDSVQITSVIMMMGALIFFPVGIWFLPGFDWHQISTTGWISYIYITFFSSALSYLLLTFALNKIDSSQVSIFMNAQPIIAAIFSALAYGEVLTANLIIGGLVTIAGIFLTQKEY